MARFNSNSNLDSKLDDLKHSDHFLIRDHAQIFRLIVLSLLSAVDLFLSSQFYSRLICDVISVVSLYSDTMVQYSTLWNPNPNQ